eukprot:scaffold115504_cov48-Phaeocystis_antarctica.AAC.1
MDTGAASTSIARLSIWLSARVRSGGVLNIDHDLGIKHRVCARCTWNTDRMPLLIASSCAPPSRVAPTLPACAGPTPGSTRYGTTASRS